MDEVGLGDPAEAGLGVDALTCTGSGGRMRFIAVIKERDVIERILTHAGLSAARIVAAPARRRDDTS